MARGRSVRVFGLWSSRATVVCEHAGIFDSDSLRSHVSVPVLPCSRLC